MTPEPATGILSLNMADYIIVAIILMSTLISIFRGFVKEFISLFVWILGFWVALKFYPVFTLILEPYITSLALRQIISFIGIFILVLIFGAMFNYALSFVVVKTGLSGTDRLLGVIFGFARGVLLVAVVLLLVSSTSFVQDPWWKESTVIPHFQFLIDWLRVFLPQKMTDITGAVMSAPTPT